MRYQQALSRHVAIHDFCQGVVSPPRSLVSCLSSSAFTLLSAMEYAAQANTKQTRSKIRKISEMASFDPAAPLEDSPFRLLDLPIEVSWPVSSIMSSFKLIAAKILCDIASIVDKDADLVSFSKANRITSSIVFGTHLPLWGSRFKLFYDKSTDKDNDGMRDAYILRSTCMKLAPTFTGLEDIFLGALVDVALGKSTLENLVRV